MSDFDKYVRQNNSGFTLLEVMVALAILAVVAVTASQASRTYTQSVSNMKTRTHAYFVAQNALADLRIGSVWLTAEQSKQVEEDGQQWQVTLTPQDIDTTAFKSDSLKKVSVAVAPIDDGKVLHNLVTVDAVVAKPAQTLNGMGQ